MSIYLKRINIISFGKFENTVIEFDKHFNLIYGRNESGKSTIISFIEGILYGFDEGKKVRRFNEKKEKFRPINSYKYAGFAIFNKDGIDYRISRNFDDGSYEIYDIDNRQIINSKESNLNYPGEFILGADYDLYRNIISNYSNQESSEKVRTKIIELLTNKDDYNFSQNDAIDYLNQRLVDIGSNRAYTKPYAKSKLEIDELNEKLNNLSSLRKTFMADFKKLYKMREDLSKKNSRLKELKDSRDNYRENIAYQNLEDEIRWNNELNFVNDKLKEYKNYDQIDTSIFDKKEIEKNRINPIFILAIAVIISMFLVIFKIYYFITIIMTVAILYYIYTQNTPNEKENEDKLENKYNINRKDYINYQKLISEKEKIEEILNVLRNQDKTRAKENIMELKELDINKIEDEIKKLETELYDLNNDNIELEKKLATIEEKLETEVELKDRLNYLNNNLKDMQDEIEAIEIAKNYIKEVVEENSSDYKNFERKVSDIIFTITKGKYTKILYDKNLLPQILSEDGSVVSLDKLSTGFYDQLNFSLRFSIGESEFDNFMIFDDAFVNYDIERLRRALFFLLDISSNRQIIYLTCHNREEEILLSESIDINKIVLEDA